MIYAKVNFLTAKASGFNGGNNLISVLDANQAFEINGTVLNYRVSYPQSLHLLTICSFPIHITTTGSTVYLHRSVQDVKLQRRRACIFVKTVQKTIYLPSCKLKTDAFRDV